MCSGRLCGLLQGIIDLPAGFDLMVHGLSSDSRTVRAGDLFFALAADEMLAEAHLLEAIAAGAVVVLKNVVQKNSGHASGDALQIKEVAGVLVVSLPDLIHQVALIADRFYQEPSARMAVVGVTGTNGKTSVSGYLAQLLSAGDIPCGVIGTLGFGMMRATGQAAPAPAWMPTWIPTGYTTPDAVQVQRLLHRLGEQGAQSVAMEVSSHALTQARVSGVRFTGAIFTNLTRDHLDYHGSMAAYGEAKATLFTRPGLRFVVINHDDPFGQQLAQQIAGTSDLVRYSLHEADVELWTRSLTLTGSGFQAELDGIWGRFAISAPLLGLFNVSNLLAAMAAALSLGVPVPTLVNAVGQLQPVAGRLQSFTSADGLRVVVDYAHTPDALAKALMALRPHTQGRLLCVFGCGGDRDRGKRAEMAAAAEAGADDLLVTDDNPRNEAPQQIFDDIASGFQHPGKVRFEHNRKLALRQMIESAQPEDVVLVAGKGHEDYQEVRGKRYPYSDLATVADLLAQRGLAK